MIRYIGILILCPVAGYLLAQVFMSAEGASAGAAKGLFIGLLVAWGEWKSKQPTEAEPEALSVTLHNHLGR